MKTVEVHTEIDDDATIYKIEIRVPNNERLTDYTKSTIIRNLEQHEKHRLTMFQQDD